MRNLSFTTITTTAPDRGRPGARVSASVRASWGIVVYTGIGETP